MKFNPTYVFMYAAYTFDKVCDDGYVCSVNKHNNRSLGEPFTAGRPLSGIVLQAVENDCAHFVSRCLFWGGFRQIPSDGPYKGIAGAPRLVAHLKKFPQIINVNKPINNGPSSASIVRRLKCGDVIAYSNSKDPNSYKHMAIHLHNGMIACHTASRWGKQFDDLGLGAYGFLTLISFRPGYRLDVPGLGFT